MKYNLFILLPNLSEEEIKSAQAGLAEIFKKVDAKVESVEEVGKRKLSYGIKNARYGFYQDYILSLDKDKIKELKKELKLNSEILRFEFSCVKRQKVQKPKKERKVVNSEDAEKTQKKDKPKISMEDLDKKLDNILETKNI